jgi:hypothetical protein
LSARVVVSRWLARIALLLVWSLVGWGALVVLATLGHVVGEGPGAALARLAPPAGASAWAWGNALAAALAVGVGIVAVGFWMLSRASRGGLGGRDAPPGS